MVLSGVPKETEGGLLLIRRSIAAPAKPIPLYSGTLPGNSKITVN
jgi:hypothetical protein